MNLALCIRSGDGFEAMKLYPVCGYNNGVQVVRENEQSDAEITILHNYGIELHNPERYDGAVFVEVSFDEMGIKIPTIPIEYML